MLALWPASTTLAPLVAFVVLNGAANGGFFSTIPTVVGNVFGSQRVSVAMAMVVTGWGGGYLMVSRHVSPCRFPLAYENRVPQLLDICWMPTAEQKADFKRTGLR